jgi:hypothetical protein
MDYTIIPHIPQEQLPKIRQDLLLAFKEFPEYIGTDYVCGGFAALGNASSFHHPYIRNLRNEGFHKVCGNIKTDLQYKELLFDRIMYRRKGQKPQAESWHRDISPGKNENDTIFQCWINLDSTDQFLSAVPGTQIDTKSGFAKIEKSMHKELKEKSQKIKIPPGHIIAFNQNLIHEIIATTAKTDMLRVYFGVRFTNSESPLFDKNEIFDKQSVPQIPSGQYPPIYSINHLTLFMNRPFTKYENLQDYSAQNFHPEILKQFYSKKNKTYHTICPRVLPSLAELNMKLYENYSESEKKLYFPH